MKNTANHLIRLILIQTILFFVPKVYGQHVSQNDINSVREFIRSSWEKTIRFNTDDKDDLIGLPYKYTVPSISNSFQSLYYWDTYFANEGLILGGCVDLARSNVENMLYMVERYGKMLNGNRTYFKNRSQPPYLSMMVESVYRETEDKAWLEKVLPTLKKEYDFWMTKRLTPIGLNRYSNEATTAQKERMITVLNKRLGRNFQMKNENLSKEELLKTGSHFIAECESGWDFTPRFEQRCEDFCPVDLNANLYYYEKNFDFFASELGNQTEANEWAQKAEQRKQLINRYCKNTQTGLYYDYDHVNSRQSDVVSGAIFSLLYAKVLSVEEVKKICDELLKKLECPHGISACENKDYGYPYQWSFPNGWAPLNFLAVKGLDNYGLKKDAKRIAGKYLSIVARTYKETGNLWEKYNVVEGNVNVANEYTMPTMMGWTAGTFVWAAEYLSKNSLTGDSQEQAPVLCRVTALTETKHSQPVMLFNLDYQDMQNIKKDLKKGRLEIKNAYSRIIIKADSILPLAPHKVTDGDIPPTGDVHDFFTIGKYAHPNPGTSDSLPYIRKDGIINPEAFTDRYDLNRYEQTTGRVCTLALAWFYSDDEKYAAKAAELLRVWFINPETRMNPNFQCAAAQPGKYDGMAIGIIFGARLVDFLDHVQLLTLSESWTAGDDKRLKNWFNEYLIWLLTSDFGVIESRADNNNHGTWYAAQVAAAAIYNNKIELAKSMIDKGRMQLSIQLAKNSARYPDGALPKEIGRSQSFLYSLYGLQGFCALAGCGKAIKYDLWHYETENGQSLRLAFDFIVPYLLEEKAWEYDTLKGVKEQIPSSLQMLSQAAKAFQTKELLKAQEHVYKYVKNDPYKLLTTPIPF